VTQSMTIMEVHLTPLNVILIPAVTLHDYDPVTLRMCNLSIMIGKSEHFMAFSFRDVFQCKVPVRNVMRIYPQFNVAPLN
jgi:hypothetical protein